MFFQQFLLYLIIAFSSLLIFPQRSSLSLSVEKTCIYLISDEFEEVSKSKDVMTAIDSLYVNALRINDNDISETLVSLTFATLPYHEVPLKLPIINVTFYYKLIAPPDSLYFKKNQQLPTQIFTDSPKNSFGDKDKLAHFFGAAFLSYNSPLFDLTDIIGYFVEAFEESFKVEGGFDVRDIRVNNLGKAFGKALDKNKRTLPSEILNIQRQSE